jgi:hypothetical protein
VSSRLPVSNLRKYLATHAGVDVDFGEPITLFYVLNNGMQIGRDDGFVSTTIKINLVSLKHAVPQNDAGRFHFNISSVTL